MELGPQNHNRDGLLGPNSIMVVYMDPLGYYWGIYTVQESGLRMYFARVCKACKGILLCSEASLGVSFYSKPQKVGNGIQDS